MKLLPLALIGGGLYVAAAPKKKKKKKKTSGAKSAGESIDTLYQSGATVGAVKNLSNYVVGPIGIVKAGSGIQPKDFIKYPTVMPQILFKFPKSAKGNAKMAGETVSALFFAQGPNFGKLVVDSGDFELAGTQNVEHLVTNIKGSAAKLILEEMMALVATKNYDLSEPSGTMDRAIVETLSMVAPNVKFPDTIDPSSKFGKVIEGTALLGQLAYQSWWNQQG